MIARRVTQFVRDHLSFVPARHILRSPITITILVGVLLGLTGGIVAAGAGRSDQVVVGNTGGTLSGVIQVGGATIVVGGGNARSDLADLVGRATLPWNRHIDLMIIPGWDNQQPLGVLGLIERGGIDQILVAGQPASNPTWVAMQAAAASSAIPVNVFTGHQSVTVAPDISIDLFAGPPTSGATLEYAAITLRFHQTLLTFVDASSAGATSLGSLADPSPHAQVLVAMRALAAFPSDSDVVLQPQAAKSSDLSTLNAAYLGEIRTGQHLKIRLKPDEVRLPLSTLTAVVPQTP